MGLMGRSYRKNARVGRGAGPCSGSPDRFNWDMRQLSRRMIFDEVSFADIPSIPLIKEPILSYDCISL